MERAKATFVSPTARPLLPRVSILVTLAVFAATLFVAGLPLRRQIQEQLAGRDGEALYAVAIMQQLAEEEEWGDGTMGDTPADLFTVLLKTSRLKGVLAARLFAPDGSFWAAFPETAREDALTAEELAPLLNLRPSSRFHPSAQLDEHFFMFDEDERPQPLLEVLIPLHHRDKEALLGAAQFILAGHSLAAEFAALDRRLLWQGAATFLIGASIIVSAMLWAFGRLDRANHLLSERTASLLRANHELALAAKTSAVGAVSAHLLHGLKNPLSGLQNFLQSRKGSPTMGASSEWDDLVATTRRMQNLVNDAVHVLQDDAHLNEYEISMEELMEILAGKSREVAQVAQVRFTSTLQARGVLANREANLILLILENLIQNAVEATPPGRVVALNITEEGDAVVCHVEDQGEGVPEALHNKLFTPCRSGKAGGSGLGLAISRQLATHLGADLALKSSSPRGSVFTLVLPKKIFLSPHSGATLPVAS
jgi:signal transduction histidine kinase